MAVIFRDKFWPKFQQEFLPKFQNFGSNLNKIFYKILVNLNILPILFAVVLLSLLQYYNKNPVRNLVSISAILLLKYCYTFSYRQFHRKLIDIKNISLKVQISFVVEDTRGAEGKTTDLGHGITNHAYTQDPTRITAVTNRHRGDKPSPW